MGDPSSGKTVVKLGPKHSNFHPRLPQFMSNTRVPRTISIAQRRECAHRSARTDLLHGVADLYLNALNDRDDRDLIGSNASCLIKSSVDGVCKQEVNRRCGFMGNGDARRSSQTSWCSDPNRFRQHLWAMKGVEEKS
ncbi:hypothetical protein GLAREA_12853 [Glarea lozoyensis ATCC 20868]|uniref:Uncharacterized protein n=1 Tax=Glarea lozoyensis (strain ATCC 20868 / MF5171) TaxID=1116229 RepID=S3CWU5_GLAL2|nr:uncharacterized protein GLAREA_12853 [Glarea lozoyensis ATCC 20868]EPE30130.1 hypothetical protein GLAREA_12853 [Glarea lozoyensis ATCC 20868]